MSEQGAIKIETEFGPIWCHYSELVNTLKIRRHFESDIFTREFDLNDGEPDYLEKIRLADLKKVDGLKALGGYKKTPDLWREAYRLLENRALLDTPEQTATPESGGAVVPPKAEKTVVPTTKLREYYKCFKTVEQGLHPALAKGYLEEPGKLRDIWNKSRKAFEDYENKTPWPNNEDKRRPLPPSPAELSEVENTNEFTSFFMKNEIHLDSFSVQYVFREINPWQTRQGVFEDGKAATRSGRGGIDLLMRSGKDSNKFPIVGEVKVGGDKNAFFALIQAMTYAVELSTESQQERLKVTFPNHFGGLNPQNPKVDIALILVNKTTDLTFDSIRSLVEKINQDKGFNGLNHVSILKNEANSWNYYD